MKCVRCNTVWPCEQIDADPDAVIFQRVGGILFNCPSCSGESITLVTVAILDGINAERIARNALGIDTSDHQVTIEHRATKILPREHLSDYVRECYAFFPDRWERASENPAGAILDAVESRPTFSVLITGNDVLITLNNR